MKRRDFLKTAGLCAAGVTLLPPGFAVAEALAAQKEGALTRSATERSAKRWAMVIFSQKMASPALQQKVAEACHSYHNVPALSGPKEVKWLWSDDYAATFPEQASNFPAKAVRERRYLLLCNHCENPPCVRVCPTQATFQREDGIVAMDYHRCIGCRFCMAGCPYGARSFNFSDPQKHVARPNLEFPMRMRGVVEKCTFCSELLSKGKMPLCVEASGGGILFGDLLDEKSTVRKALEENAAIRRKPSLGTQPGVYYIL
ncbi:4Fe-4S dicluster domain-containing protein [Desulfovibrio sp. OttesenSCG-928-O18]|nr:4Fe-4S dicluster domain-containing protein [Desulfovibrio sp. OttesenSCG-928-O18]